MTVDIESVIHQIDEILEIAEAVIPAKPSSKENSKLADRTEEIMAAYFKGLEQAFPYYQLEAIYNKHIKPIEALRTVVKLPFPDDDDWLEPFLRMFRAKLTTDLMGQHVSAYLTGSAEVISWGVTKGGFPITYEGPPVKQAIDYAREHCAQLVTKMDEETKAQLAQVISDGIKNKRGIDGLARDIRKQFEDMSTNRSKLIAKNETADALEQAFIDRGNDMGITGKESVSVGDDRVSEICLANEAQGVIPFNEPFLSGHMRPPFHIACRCALAPAMLKEK